MLSTIVPDHPRNPEFNEAISKQNLVSPVNDRFKLRVDLQPQEHDREFVPAQGVIKPVEKPFGQGIGCGATEDPNIISPSTNQASYPYQNDPAWSKSGKAIARTAFDAARERELHEVIQKAKQMANEIRQSSDLWDLEDYLTERRKEIDRKYDYRFSKLTHVFGRLLHEGRISEEELRGLRDDKLKSIRSFAEAFAKYAA